MHHDNASGRSGIHAICFRRPPSGVDGMAAGGKDCDNIGTHDSTPTIGLLAYIILGISGFGSALVTIPLLVHFLPLQTVVPLAVLVDFLATATTGIRFREDVETAELKI